LLLSRLAVAGFCVCNHLRISIFTSSLLWNRRPLHSCLSRPNKWSVLNNTTHSRGPTSDTRPSAVVSVGTSGPWLDRCLWRWRHCSPSNSRGTIRPSTQRPMGDKNESSTARVWFKTFHSNDCINYYLDVRSVGCIVLPKTNNWLWPLKQHWRVAEYTAIIEWTLIFVNGYKFNITIRIFYTLYNTGKGTAVAHWLRCCAINRKVAGSIPDVVIGIFHWHNPSDRTMALGSTQPLTEMSTRSISWG